MKQKASIKDWIVTNNYLVGRVIDHPNQKNFLGEYQRTSTLVSIDIEAGIAETQNTIYTLLK